MALINDAPALRVADVSISVDSGVDIAKELATVILLEKSLMFAFGRCERGTSYGNPSIAHFMESAALWNVDAIEAGPGAEPGFN
jgi:hypothetical protein